MECEDLCVATLRFRSGALGIIEATTATRPSDIEASLSVLGEGGVIVLGGLAMNRIEHWDFADRRDYDATVKTDYFEFVPNAYGFGHDTLYRRVVASVRDGGPVEIPAEEGLRSIRLLHAIYASHEREARVRMQDHPASRRLGLPPVTVRATRNQTREAGAVAACLTNTLEGLDSYSGLVAGIIGELPSKTAKSPSIWNHALRRLSIDARFVAFDTSAVRLGELVKALRAWPAYVGGSVTVPYKVDIVPHLDDLTPAARAIGAVNTVFRREDGGLVGDNTDAAGAVAALTRPADGEAPFIHSLDGMRVLLLGAGGAGRAVAVALAGAIGTGSLAIASRVSAHADAVAALARGVNPRVTAVPMDDLAGMLASADLLVNCTSCGQAGVRTDPAGQAFTLEPYSPLASATPAPVPRGQSDQETLRACLALAVDEVERNNRESLARLLAAPPSLRVFDIVYAPLETVLLRQARLSGHQVLNGKPMNIQQAVTAMFDVVLRRYFDAHGLANESVRRAVYDAMSDVW
jgi:shikimate 5-dehydrogenase